MKKGKDGFYRKTFTYDGKRYGYGLQHPNCCMRNLLK